MYDNTDETDVDNKINERTSSLPLLGFFAGGEIGPVERRAYTHSFTSCLAVFRAQEVGGKKSKTRPSCFVQPRLFDQFVINTPSIFTLGAAAAVAVSVTTFAMSRTNRNQYPRRASTIPPGWNSWACVTDAFPQCYKSN